MAWGKGREPTYKSEKIGIEVVRSKAIEARAGEGGDPSRRVNGIDPAADSWARKLELLLRFLESLDWTKTEIYYIEDNGTHSGSRGWKVVHYSVMPPIDSETGRFNYSWGQTWFSLGGWMS